MPAAANLLEAAFLAGQNVQFNYQSAGRNLRTQLDAWIAQLDALFAEAEPTQRTVRNWSVIGTPLSAAVPTAKASQTQGNANDIGVYLYRTCRAAGTAQTQGRITAGQGASLLAQYNAIWP